MNITRMIAGAALAGGLAAGAVGLGAVTANAEPMGPGVNQPIPAPAAPPAGPNPGQAPSWAPPAPVPPAWAAGNPQVWDEGWQHWGVWLNGVFVPTY